MDNKKFNIETIEQIASDELNKIDERNIQSDDEGMMEEIVTTIEDDKDLECKIKKKIETKRTFIQDPEKQNPITKVIKTEVTEITHTMTINNQQDLQRAQHELGIDDIHQLLTSTKDQSHIEEKYYEPSNEIVTLGDFPSDNSIKEYLPTIENEIIQPLIEATSVGRGSVIETIPSSTIVESPLSIDKKLKIKKSYFNLCSCTHNKQKQKKKITHQTLISNDMKQFIKDKKLLLIDYIHMKIFLPSNLFLSYEQDLIGRKISFDLLDRLYNDQCLSWNNLFEQFNIENLFIQPMIKIYEDLLTNQQDNLFNLFSTIHNEKDIINMPENNDYRTIIQAYINDRDNVDRTKSMIENTLDEKG